MSVVRVAAALFGSREHLPRQLPPPPLALHLRETTIYASLLLVKQPYNRLSRHWQLNSRLPLHFHLPETAVVQVRLRRAIGALRSPRRLPMHQTHQEVVTMAPRYCRTTCRLRLRGRLAERHPTAPLMKPTKLISQAILQARAAQRAASSTLRHPYCPVHYLGKGHTVLSRKRGQQ